MSNLYRKITQKIVLVCLLLIANMAQAQVFVLKAPKGYNNYKWYSTDLITGVQTMITGADKDTLSVSKTGMYYCDFDVKSCRRKSDIVLIVSKCQLKADTAVTLNAATTSLGSYQWFKGGAAIVGANNSKKVVDFHEENDYYAEIYNGSCTLKTENFIVRSLNTGLSDISAIMLNCKQ